MIERDYFMRSIQMLTTALIKILLKKDLKQYAEAMEEIDVTGEKLIGMKWTVFRAFKHDQMVELLGDEETLAKMYAAAELLCEESDILYHEGEEIESIVQGTKSFSLYIELLLKDRSFLKMLSSEKVSSLLKRLEEFELPVAVELKRFRYYEIMGGFRKAKEIMDELIDRDPAIIAEGVLFYQRLLKLSDEEIIQNGLSKSEVENTLQKLAPRLSK
jgi:hypothetical protein